MLSALSLPLALIHRILIRCIPTVLLLLPLKSFGDGTENLGLPSINISKGSKLLVAGTGMVAQPGKITLTVPQGSTIKQVLLYWSGFFGDTSSPDDTITITPQSGSDTKIYGKLIGGITDISTNLNGATYRADITKMAIIKNGVNSLNIGGMNFDRANNGAGIVVIVSDASGETPIDIHDGQDFAYHKSTGDFHDTTEQLITFSARPVQRNATLDMLFSSVQGSVSGGGFRPNSIEVTIAGVTKKYSDLLGSKNGDEWDTVHIPVEIPPNMTTARIRAFSRDDLNSGNNPASLVWNLVGLHIPNHRPSCQAYPNVNGPITIRSGEKFIGSVKAFDIDGDKLTISYRGLPSGATVTPTANTTHPQPTEAHIEWTPTVNDRGSSHDIVTTFTDERGVDVSCVLSLIVKENSPPVCKLSKDSFQSLPCNSLATTVNLNGSASYDPDGDSLSYLWMTNCPDGIFSTATKNTTALTFDSETASGMPVFCKAVLQVKDATHISNCPVSFSTTECHRDCKGIINGSAQYDICGICGGNGKSCLDCSGTPHGTGEYDECGVCGGTGKDICGLCPSNPKFGQKSCVDCRGKPNGNAIKDICGECEGDGTSCCRLLKFDAIALDGVALRQRALVHRAAFTLQRAKVIGLGEYNTLRRRATDLYNANWKTAYTFPQELIQCEAQAECVDIQSGDETEQVYKTNMTELRNLSLSLAKRFTAISKPWRKTKARLLRKKAQALFEEGELELKKRPRFETRCPQR